MLKKLNFNPLTRYTFSTDSEGSLPILPIPMILPTLLSPKVIFLCFFFLISVKRDSFSLRCLEKLLSRYQTSSLTFKHAYKIIDQTFLALTTNLGPTLVVIIFCGHVPFDTLTWIILTFDFLRGHE